MNYSSLFLILLDQLRSILGFKLSWLRYSYGHSKSIHIYRLRSPRYTRLAAIYAQFALLTSLQLIERNRDKMSIPYIELDSNVVH